MANMLRGATLAGFGGVLGRSAFDVATGGRLTGRLGTGVPAPSRYIKIPGEKVAKNVKSQANIRAKGAAGKRVPGNPSNPRTVIRAAPGSGNPDVVVGDVTFLDWMDRTESMLDPQEIVKAAKWYQEVFPQFVRASGLRFGRRPRHTDMDGRRPNGRRAVRG